jgi:MFS family permease
MASSHGAILLYTTGLLQGPIVAEFGWTRAQYFLITPLSALAALIMVVPIGTALDRIGVRRVVLPSMLLLALCLMAFSRLTGSLAQFYGLAFLLAILASGATSAAYARLVTLWFDRRRGFALGVALAGFGIGGATLSPLVQWAITHHGWRGGYLALTLFVLLGALPMLFVLLRDSPGAVGLGQDGAALGQPSTSRATVPAPVGLTAREALRSPVFWLLVSAFATLGFALGGMLFQLFPILTSLGVPASTATIVLGSMGLALIAGRATAGFLMDRLFAPRVAVAFLVGPVVGCIALANGAAGASAMAGALLIGLAAGAEVDVLAYLVSRYFGTRAYATTYGWIYAAFSTGSGLGPLLGARLFDLGGSYILALWAYAALFAVACVLMLNLRPFPRLSPAASDPPPTR